MFSNADNGEIYDGKFRNDTRYQSIINLIIYQFV
jgi:hypothetical protein